MTSFINSSQFSFDIVSPSIFKREETINLSSETLAIIGSSKKGPAFVPVQVVTFEEDNSVDGILNTWENTFGKFSSQEMNPSVVTAKKWLDNQSQLSFTRILGCKSRFDESSDVNQKLGFIVGDKVVSGSITSNKKDNNSYSYSGGKPGRTYFLGDVVSGSNIQGEITSTADYFEQLGFDSSVESLGFVNKIVFASSGSMLQYQDEHIDDLDAARNDLLAQNDGLNNLGSSVTLVSNPKLFIKGLKDKSYNSLSYDVYDLRKTEYGENYLNKIEDCFLEKGNFLYLDAGSNNEFTKVNTKISQEKHFILSGSAGWNSSGDSPNYEDFSAEFKTAKTPWVVSQPIEKESTTNRQNIKEKCIKLFRFHSLSDGESGNNIRIRITPLMVNKDAESTMEYSRFSLEIFEYNLSENKYYTVLKFDAVDLNPKSEIYICKLLGTQREFYNFETGKIEISGFYSKTNNHIRVEVNQDIEDGKTLARLIPSGFYAYPTIDIDKTKTTCLNEKVTSDSFVHEFIFKPVEYVPNILLSEKDLKSKIENPYWGVLFNKTNMVKIEDFYWEGQNIKVNFLKADDDSEENISPVYYLSKYLKEGFILGEEEERFNGFFHLEKILYLPSRGNLFDRWEMSLYRRDGKEASSITSLLTMKDDYVYLDIDSALESENNNVSENSRFLSFDLFTYGGFDGIDILDRDKRRINNVSLQRELEDELNDETIYEGPTYRALNIARDITTEYSNNARTYFLTPGYCHYKFNKKSIEIANLKKDFVSIIDIPEYDSSDNLIIGNIFHLNYKNPDKFYIQDLDVDLKIKVQEGTERTLQAFSNQNILSYYSSAYLNRCIGSEEYDKFELPASSNYILMLSATPLGLPVDSSAIDFGTYELLNTEFNDRSEEWDDYLNKSKNSDHNINLFSRSVSRGIRLSSDNLLVDDRYNLKRYMFNRRILLSIKNRLLNLIYTGDAGSDPVLFNNNDSLGFVYQSFNLSLENLFRSLLDEGLIKNYKIDIQSRNSSNTINDRLNHVLRGKIEFELLGNSKIQIETFDLNDVLNNVSNINLNVYDLVNNIEL